MVALEIRSQNSFPRHHGWLTFGEFPTERLTRIWGDHTSHVMGSCPALMWTRAKIFNQYFMEPPFELPIGKVLLFMKECGLEPIKWDD